MNLDALLEHELCGQRGIQPAGNQCHALFFHLNNVSAFARWPVGAFLCNAHTRKHANAQTCQRETKRSSPSTFTSNFWTLIDGSIAHSPVFTSYSQPCQGQLTVVPARLPSPSGPPRCLHVLSIAKNVPSELKMATVLPPISTTFPVPGGISVFFAILVMTAMVSSVSRRDRLHVTSDMYMPDLSLVACHLSRFLDKVFHDRREVRALERLSYQRDATAQCRFLILVGRPVRLVEQADRDARPPLKRLLNRQPEVR